MTATTAKPVAGPTFRAAAALPVDGAKRRRLLCLLAAYADAGEHSPRMRELSRITGFEVPMIDQLLKALQRDGYVRVPWRASDHHPHRRNVYELTFGGPEDGTR
jgi:hypothetical protein